MAVATYNVPRALQMAFIGAIVAEFVVQAALTTSAMITQYPTNQNLSAYYIFLSQMFLLPIIFVVTAFLLTPRKLPILPKAFESLLMTAVALTILQLLTFLSTYIQLFASPSDLGSYQLWVSVVATILYVGGLVSWRQMDRKK